MAAQKLTYQSEGTPEIFWTVYKNGQAQKIFFTPKNRVNYLPYGKTLRQFVTPPGEKFLTTQHERDFETGLDYRGARFLSLDPLAAEYTSQSDYMYVNGNPLIFIDPDGKEGIVVSGQPGPHKNKEHFLVNGLYKAKAAQGHLQNSGEKVTWLVFNDGGEGGHDEEMLEKYRALAQEAGINFQVVTDEDQVVSYVNRKIAGLDERANDKITSFYYVGHALPGSMDIGYGGDGWDHYVNPSEFKPEAFASGCWVNVVGGCRTAVDDWIQPSVIEQFSEILDVYSRIFGSSVRTQYSGGIVSDENLVKENEGEIIEINGKLPAKDE